MPKASPAQLVDDVEDRGFGGIVGAHRHIPPYDHGHVETLPAASSVDYGPAPGLNPAFGSRGQDGTPVK